MEDQTLFLKTVTPKMSWFMETTIQIWMWKVFCPVTFAALSCSWPTDLNLLCLLGISVWMSSWLSKTKFFQNCLPSAHNQSFFCSFCVWCFNPAVIQTQTLPSLLLNTFQFSHQASSLCNASFAIYLQNISYFPFLLTLSWLWPYTLSAGLLKWPVASAFDIDAQFHHLPSSYWQQSIHSPIIFHLCYFNSILSGLPAFKLVLQRPCSICWLDWSFNPANHCMSLSSFTFHMPMAEW